MLKKCNNSLYYFVQFFRQFRAYDDPLCKLIMVNAIRYEQREIYKFNEPIMPGIDYQILKQLLRQGIIVPNDQISAKIGKYGILTKDEAADFRKSALFSFLKIMNETGRGEIKKKSKKRCFSRNLSMDDIVINTSTVLKPSV